MMTREEAYGIMLRAAVYLAIDRIKADADIPAIQPALTICTDGMHAALYPDGCRPGADACKLCVRLAGR